MKEFCKKYDLKEATAKALIKDGWITCSLPQYEEVVIHYRSSHSMQKTADHFNIDKRTVYNIVHKLNI
ncbi:MAG TPA: helix-turn-helix domain-containing protein [Cyclobacteriaceae bacterium]|nr:helix-turn-helix domain-containing protein [Cyclobacteriaceae bacterium]HNA14709.1 helix-turn-helix domain-containing protein [Cyclobacteriaceae bacterium]